MAKTYYDQDANWEVLNGKKVAIIGYGSQYRSIDCQRHCRQSLPFLLKTAHKLRCQVLAVCRASPVTAEKHLVTFCQRPFFFSFTITKSGLLQVRA